MATKIAFLQRQLRAFWTVALLFAFMVPLAAQANCLNVTSSSPVTSPALSNGEPASAGFSDLASAASIQHGVPQSAPAEPANDTKACQHGHCGHAQAWPALPLAQLTPIFGRGPRLDGELLDDFTANGLLGGPERPPRA